MRETTQALAGAYGVVEIHPDGRRTRQVGGLDGYAQPFLFESRMHAETSREVAARAMPEANLEVRYFEVPDAGFRYPVLRADGVSVEPAMSGC